MRIWIAALLAGLGCSPALAQEAAHRSTVAAMNTYSGEAKLKASFKAGDCRPAEAGSFACTVTVKGSTLSQPYGFAAIYRRKNGSAAQFSLPIADTDQVAGAALGTAVGASILTSEVFDVAQVSAFLAQEMQAAISQQHAQSQQVNGVKFTVSKAGDFGFQVVIEKAAKSK
ncbi:hypothetical protein [Labrys monachus]|uniref:Uncharacterized protein n=1 Tax=Labrys monachus TaxID=217067 RepID=A0ABU0FGU6_9HYPH|nr:hypothetical protein [Labrys monachus]MDQ0393837.1 hypothetical protein [Labrys monachus]